MQSKPNLHYKPAKRTEKRRKRVAVYARVSRPSTRSRKSLANQMDSYRATYGNNSRYELIGIYADYGVSGAKVNRPEFDRMIKDCRDGRIDLVVTKSVSRFARNIVGLLEVVRELKDLGVDVYFEKEKLHSDNPTGEFTLAWLSKFAEMEALSTSKNIKWRIKKKYEAGKPVNNNTFGYRLVDGEYRIVPEEAEYVRRIFELSLLGYGREKIAKMLNKERIAKNSSIEEFHPPKIKYILENEIYYGKLVLQKTFSANPISHKIVKNKGMAPMYIVEEAHEAIISKETFDAVQKAKARRNENIKKDFCGKDEEWFYKLIHCGKCGKCFYKHIRQKLDDDWECATYRKKGKRFCDAPRLLDNLLKEMAVQVVNEFTGKAYIVPDVDKELIRTYITRIDVNKSIQFVMRDGRVIEKTLP